MKRNMELKREDKTAPSQEDVKKQLQQRKAKKQKKNLKQLKENKSGS